VSLFFFGWGSLAICFIGLVFWLWGDLCVLSSESFCRFGFVGFFFFGFSLVFFFFLFVFFVVFFIVFSVGFFFFFFFSLFFLFVFFFFFWLLHLSSTRDTGLFHHRAVSNTVFRFFFFFSCIRTPPFPVSPAPFTDEP